MWEERFLPEHIGPSDVLIASAKAAKEAQEKAECLARDQEVERKQLELKRRRKLYQARLAALQAQFEAGESELHRIIGQEFSR